MFNSITLTKLEQEQIKALQRHDFKKVKKFIEQGMDVNKVFAEEGRRRPIHLLIPYRFRPEQGPVVLEYLLKREGVNVNGLDGLGNTALMYAAMRGNLVACRLLIQHGADYCLRSQQFKKNASELFKELNDDLFSEFEEIIKKHEETIKAEANSDTKIVSETPYSNVAPGLKQRKHGQDKIINSSCSSAVSPFAQQEDAKSYKLSFWKIVSCFRRHPDAGETPYIPLNNTPPQDLPKLS